MNVCKQTRIRLVLAGLVLICGVSLMALVYLLINKPVVENSPNIVVSTPSPVAVPVVNHENMLLRGRIISHPTPYRSESRPVWLDNPSSPSSFKIYTTSSATTHSVGGGTGSGFILATTSHASQRGIQAQTNLAVNTFVVLASSRQLSAPEAGEAPQMAHLASYDPRHAPGPPNTGEGGVPGDHQLVEHPIGDGLWMMVVMAMLYFFCKYATKKSAAK